MDESYSSYSEMLEIPVNTCTIKVKEDKKKSLQRKKLINLEETKKKLLDKINKKSEVVEQKNTNGNADNAIVDVDENKEEKMPTVVPSEVTIKSKKSNTVSRYFAKIGKKFNKINIKKPSVIGVQIAVIIGLTLLICLTTIFNADSGIMVFMKSVFKSNNTSEVLSDITYDKCEVNIGYKDYELTNGVITVADNGSVYSPVDGIITSVTEELGKYVVEVSKSQKFSTKISGLTYAFCKVGDSVYSNIPIGYMGEDNYSVCFLSEGDIVENYSIEENKVVWQK